jgi:hypothetical protein
MTRGRGTAYQKKSPLVPGRTEAGMSKAIPWRGTNVDIGKGWKGTFRMIPDSLWQHADAELIDLKVWCALSLHARDRDQITSTNASLARSAETSPATLKRSLSRLCKMGFVRMEGETSRRVIHLCPDAQTTVYTIRLAHG